jgi:hypothetical protein
VCTTELLASATAVYTTVKSAASTAVPAVPAVSKVVANTMRIGEMTFLRTRTITALLAAANKKEVMYTVL